MIKKSKILTFMFAIIPGVGHLYLNFTKQGLQIMIGTCACIIFIPSIPLVFSFALAILWFYQMFDALQKAAWMKAAAAEHERMMMGQETFGYPWTAQDWMTLGGYQKETTLSPVWIGAGCILFGVMVLLTTIFPDLWHWLLKGNVASVLLAVALIGYGLRILFKKPDHKGSGIL
ncbi:hypothetical protein MUG84_13840 [Paenibacillus sp. KQZ6P-2]|uniref:TM2 domain-containing protein n=1 Tax=Paenibacillus mangrovi TaxID=2931978 RepID=A0A9X1WSP5_9BACL|nr:hypothetical protein [Paenibacillus mangrovi]MCJ8012815.1 hypothetical protein [Paenibacillus mangrovi]